MISANDGVSRLLRRTIVLTGDPDSARNMLRPPVSEVSGSSAFSVQMRTGEVVLLMCDSQVFPRIMCCVGSAVPSTESWVAEPHRFTECFYMKIDAVRGDRRAVRNYGQGSSSEGFSIPPNKSLQPTETTGLFLHSTSVRLRG
jgi:hypothetical protein